MMKKIIIMTLAMLMVAGSAFAVESSLTGRFIFEGSYYDNFEFATDDQYSFADYDMDWRVNWTLKISPATKVITRVSMHDETVGLNTGDTGAWSGEATAELDDNVAIERAFISQAFSPKIVLDLGLMAGGVWSTKFNDNGDDFYRVKLTTVGYLGSDFIVGVLEKNKENGSNVPPIVDVDQEKDDWDKYVIVAQYTVAGIKLHPLVGYVVKGSTFVDGESDDTTVWALQLGAMGSTDMIGWEAEIDYNMYSFGDSVEALLGEDSGTTWGAYANVWGNLDMAKVGLWVAYGSYDKDANLSFDFGDDFDSSMIIGDDLEGGDLNGGDLEAATAFALYADITPMEKLTITPLFMYAMSNVDDDDSTAYEFDLWGSYQLTDEVKYTVGFGYASVDIDVNGVTTDTDPAMKLYHELRLDF